MNDKEVKETIESITNRIGADYWRDLMDFAKKPAREPERGFFQQMERRGRV